MSDGIGLADVLLGLSGFRVLDVVEPTASLEPASSGGNAGPSIGVGPASRAKTNEPKLTWWSSSRHVPGRDLRRDVGDR
jgi:hypothetical protein